MYIYISLYVCVYIVIYYFIYMTKQVFSIQM